MAPAKLYTPSQAAALLLVRVDTIYRRIADGSIKATFLSSRAIRIAEAEVLRLQREDFSARRAPRNGRHAPAVEGVPT